MNKMRDKAENEEKMYKAVMNYHIWRYFRDRNKMNRMSE